MMDTPEFKLNEAGNVVELGTFKGDPFIDDRWSGIVEEIQRRFPGVDLVIFQVEGAYTGYASLSESLDPMKLTMDMMQQGIMCMGSNKKVNLMTEKQFGDILKTIEGHLRDS